MEYFEIMDTNITEVEEWLDFEADLAESDPWAEWSAWGFAPFFGNMLKKLRKVGKMGIFQTQFLGGSKMGILGVFRNFLSRPPTDAAAGFSL